MGLPPLRGRIGRSLAGEGETRQLWLCDVGEVISHRRDAIEWDEMLPRTPKYDLAPRSLLSSTRTSREASVCPPPRGDLNGCPGL